jgi:erythromycin esterase-like protein
VVCRDLKPVLMVEAAPRLRHVLPVPAAEPPRYRPETERWSHYMEAVLAGQLDAWVWFDETRAVKPLATASGPGEEEMWPS